MVKPNIKTLIPLPTDISVTGSVDTEQVRNLDLEDRWWKSTGDMIDSELCDRIVAMLAILLRS